MTAARRLDRVGELELGQTVAYRIGFGRGPFRKAAIVGFGDYKGQLVVDLSDGHWAYATHVRPDVDPTFVPTRQLWE